MSKDRHVLNLNQRVVLVLLSFPLVIGTGCQSNPTRSEAGPDAVLMNTASNWAAEQTVGDLPVLSQVGISRNLDGTTAGLVLSDPGNSLTEFESTPNQVLAKAPTMGNALSNDRGLAMKAPPTMGSASTLNARPVMQRAPTMGSDLAITRGPGMERAPTMGRSATERAAFEKQIGLTASQVPTQSIPVVTAEPQVVQATHADLVPLAVPDMSAKIRSARQLELDERYSEAIQAFNWLIENGVETSFVYHRLAVLYEKTGRSQSAGPLYTIALEADPQNADLLADIGYRKYLDGNLESAERYYVAALEVDPAFERVHANLALVMANTNRHQLAVKHFQLAGLNAEQAKHNLALLNSDAEPSTALDDSPPSNGNKEKSTMTSRFAEFFGAK